MQWQINTLTDMYKTSITVTQQLPTIDDNSTYNQLLVGMKGHTENWSLMRWEEFLLFCLDVDTLHSEVTASITAAHVPSN